MSKSNTEMFEMIVFQSQALKFTYTHYKGYEIVSIDTVIKFWSTAKLSLLFSLVVVVELLLRL